LSKDLCPSSSGLQPSPFAVRYMFFFSLIETNIDISDVTCVIRVRISKNQKVKSRCVLGDKRKCSQID